MKKKQLSISEQISALSNPMPEGDLEDFWDEDTSAKVTHADPEDLDGGQVDQAPSGLRARAALTSLQHEVRYKGRKTTRRGVQEQFSDADSNGSPHDMPGESDDDDEEEEETVAERRNLVAKRLKEMAEKMTQGDSSDSEEEEAGSGGLFEEEQTSEDEEEEGDDDDDDDVCTEDEDEDGDEEEEEEESEAFSEEDSGIRGFSQASVSEEVEKGQAVKAQLGLWDSFMQARIKMQKALSVANQLPQFDTHELFMREGGAEIRTLMQKSERELSRLLQSFVSLQDALLNQNPETEHVLHGDQPGEETNIADGDDEDEEIPSDTDEEGEVELRKTRAPRPPPKRALEGDGEAGEHLAKRHASLAAYRDATIQKWYEKTRLATGKLNKKSFSGFERSALVQIQQVLQDRDRLVQRTQLRRSEYAVLGQRSRRPEATDDDQEANEDVPRSSNQHLKNYDPEIFDDDDFYHQLLRELIEKRTSSTTDPIQLTRQWLQVQKLRSKVKRIVDTKASKGRKLRYDVHQKLVSFMAPVENSPMPAEARVELFKSLFGGQTGNSGENR